MSYSLSYTVSLCVFLSRTHYLSLCLTQKHTHTLTTSLCLCVCVCLSLSHTHTHTPPLSLSIYFLSISKSLLIVLYLLHLFFNLNINFFNYFSPAYFCYVSVWSFPLFSLFSSFLFNSFSFSLSAFNFLHLLTPRLYYTSVISLCIFFSSSLCFTRNFVSSFSSSVLCFALSTFHTCLSFL